MRTEKALSPQPSTLRTTPTTAAPRSRQPLKITYVITDLEVGGVPLHLYRLATGLSAMGVQVRVISLAGEGPVGAMMRRSGIPVSGCGARGAWDVRALGRLYRHLRAHPPDVLHSLLFHANIAVRLVGPLAGIPPRRILCEIQTVEIERRWHLVVDNLTCRLCRLEVGNSKSVVDHLAREAHVPRSRLRCIMGGVDVDRILRAAPTERRSLGVAADDWLIVWAGRLDPIKGFEEMLTGFSRSEMRHRSRLVLAGEGPYRERIEKLIGELNIADRVFLLGRRDDVASLLRAADLFLFCSRTEGFPNALLEAMAAGCAIVVTQAPGCVDCIEHGVTGWMIPPRHAEAVARAIDLVLPDTDLRQRLETAALQWVMEHASLERCVRDWHRLYAFCSAQRWGGTEIA